MKATYRSVPSCVIYPSVVTPSGDEMVRNEFGEVVEVGALEPGIVEHAIDDDRCRRRLGLQCDGGVEAGRGGRGGSWCHPAQENAAHKCGQHCRSIQHADLPGIGMFWYITQYKARSVPPPKLARRKVPNHYTGQLVETIPHVPALTGWERTTIVGDSLGPGE